MYQWQLRRSDKLKCALGNEIKQLEAFLLDKTAAAKPPSTRTASKKKGRKTAGRGFLHRST